MTYVAEFLYRGRDPDHEAGKLADYHVVLADWQKGPDGAYKPMYTQALRPAQADDMGFKLDKILGDVATAALAHADAAKAETAGAVADRDAATEARAAAEANAVEANKTANAAVAEMMRAQQAAVDMAAKCNEIVAAKDAENKAEKQTWVDQLTAIQRADAGTIDNLQKRIDELTPTEDDSPSNPLLNWLTSGLLGK